MNNKARKRYAFNGLAGCVVQRDARQTGTLVGVYHAEQAGFDTNGGPWATVCEKHGYIMNHATRTLALDWMSEPKGWCEDCRVKERCTCGESLFDPVTGNKCTVVRPDGCEHCPSCGAAA